MIGWVVVASCPVCGGGLESVNVGRVVGNDCNAVARCVECFTECLCRVQVTAVRRDATSAAAQRKRRQREREAAMA